MRSKFITTKNMRYLEVMSGPCMGQGASRLSPARRKILHKCISQLRWKLPVRNSGGFKVYEFLYLSIILEDATMLCDDRLRCVDDVLSSRRSEVSGFSVRDNTLSISFRSDDAHSGVE